ncbi:MAG: hypothetical protein KBI42_13245, partial [Bacteroidia bacterium]|nr:hypothetical protein [Bacteroidia bacterium]
LGGALYIATVCILPSLMQQKFKVPFYFGGTSLLIVVGVALDNTFSPVVTPAARCGAGAVTLKADVGVEGKFEWYSVATGGTPLKTENGVTNSSFDTPSIGATTTYYVLFTGANQELGNKKILIFFCSLIPIRQFNPSWQ